MMMTLKLPSFVRLHKSNFIFEFFGYGIINSNSLVGNMTKGKKYNFNRYTIIISFRHSLILLDTRLGRGCWISMIFFLSLIPHKKYLGMIIYLQSSTTMPIPYKQTYSLQWCSFSLINVEKNMHFTKILNEGWWV